uniref:Uncharacterized protein n=1 Tax=Romanomermis culicivorax TaxID=13658 RepID=A0A915KTA9_ROMCU
MIHNLTMAGAKTTEPNNDVLLRIVAISAHNVSTAGYLENAPREPSFKSPFGNSPVIDSFSQAEYYCTFDCTNLGTNVELYIKSSCKSRAFRMLVNDLWQFVAADNTVRYCKCAFSQSVTVNASDRLQQKTPLTGCAKAM